MIPLVALREALADPAKLSRLSPADWSDLVALARAANLLGALAVRIKAAGVEPPMAPRRHLVGALQLSLRQRQSVTWEVHELARVLRPLQVPVVLLKGAAYVMGGHAVGHGRVFGDIDILVPRAALGAVERRLLLFGWSGTRLDAYDQRFYREWMHELPPLVHRQRGTVLDVHHTVLPLTARRTPDAVRLIERSRPLAGVDGLRVPAPEDLLVHSLSHLMHEGELDNGLRDLNDVDDMVRAFGADPAFWTRFVEVAAGHELARPVRDGLWLACQVFGSPVPPDALQALAACGAGSPAPPRWLWPVYRRALQPLGARTETPSGAVARWTVYLRSHALRMPPAMLARHLGTKAWRRLRERDSGPGPTAAG